MHGQYQCFVCVFNLHSLFLRVNKKPDDVWMRKVGGEVDGNLREVLVPGDCDTEVQLAADH